MFVYFSEMENKHKRVIPSQDEIAERLAAIRGMDPELIKNPGAVSVLINTFTVQ